MREEVEMRYKRGNVIVMVSQIDGFGKNPSLWIGTETPSQILKVASFKGDDEAKQFCKWLDYLLGIKEDVNDRARVDHMDT